MLLKYNRGYYSKMKRIAKVLIVLFLLGSTSQILHAETTHDFTIKFVGNYGTLIQLYQQSVFDEILDQSLDKKTLSNIEPFKPKKDIENPILNQINNELNDYNLAFGDLFIAKFKIGNNNIMALVLIYGTLKPTIRYYLIK